MKIDLPPALQRYVDTQVKDGRYADAGEVVRAALRRAEAQAAAAAWPLRGPGVDVIMDQMLLVMMEITRSAREDFKAMMDQMRAINAAKRGLRDLLAKIRRDVAANMCRKDATPLDFSRGLGSERAYHRVKLPHLDPDAPGGVRWVAKDLYPGKIARAADLETIVDDVEDKLDSLSELSEEDQLRMQMVMERITKADSAASNMLKKFSEITTSIIGNLK